MCAIVFAAGQGRTLVRAMFCAHSIICKYGGSTWEPMPSAL